MQCNRLSRRPGAYRGAVARRAGAVRAGINWLKRNRAGVTRFDELAVLYLATVRVAATAERLR